jgi:hypothetical protein
MMNPYSFNPYSQRNSSMMSNQSFGVKPPATFGEWLKRFFLRMWGYIIRGYSISKNILWCASIGNRDLTQLQFL